MIFKIINSIPINIIDVLEAPDSSDIEVAAAKLV